MSLNILQGRLIIPSPLFIQRAAPYFIPSLRLFRKYLHGLEESQWFPPKQLGELQNDMKEKRISPIEPLSSLGTSSQTLFSHVRNVIEEAFGAKVYAFYGSSEGVVSVGECPDGNLHINSEYDRLELAPKRLRSTLKQAGIPIEKFIELL